MQYGMFIAYQFAKATAQRLGALAENETAFNVALNTGLPLRDYMQTRPEMEKIFSG